MSVCRDSFVIRESGNMLRVILALRSYTTWLVIRIIQSLHAHRASCLYWYELKMFCGQGVPITIGYDLSVSCLTKTYKTYLQSKPILTLGKD